MPYTTATALASLPLQRHQTTYLQFQRICGAGICTTYDTHNDTIPQHAQTPIKPAKYDSNIFIATRYVYIIAKHTTPPNTVEKQQHYYDASIPTKPLYLHNCIPTTPPRFDANSVESRHANGVEIIYMPTKDLSNHLSTALYFIGAEIKLKTPK